MVAFVVVLSSAAIASAPVPGLRFVELFTPQLAASGLALSPDGRHLYTAGAFGPQVFARDPDSGALGLVAGTAVVLTATDPLISPDGLHVYALGLPDAIALFRRAPGTGRLTVTEIFRLGAQPSDFALTSDGQWLYAMNDGGELSAYERDPATGRLQHLALDRDVPRLRGPGSIAVSHDGSHAYVVHTKAPGSHDLVALRRDDARAFSLLDTLIEATANAAVDGVALDPHGELIYATGTSGHAVSVFRRDPLTGVHVLTFRTDGALGPCGEGASAIAASPDGASVYSIVAGYGVCVFHRGAEDDVIDLVHEIARGDVTAGIAVSSDGRHVYASESGGIGLYELEPEVATATSGPSLTATPTPTPSAMPTVTAPGPSRTRTRTVTPTRTSNRPPIVAIVHAAPATAFPGEVVSLVASRSNGRGSVYAEFRQLEGPPVTFIGQPTRGLMASFLAPEVGPPTMLRFQVCVRSELIQPSGCTTVAVLVIRDPRLADTTPAATPTTTITHTATATLQATATPTTPPLLPTRTHTSIATTTATPLPTQTPTAVATETPAITPPAAVCRGDCDGNRVVTLDELIRVVQMALGTRAAACAVIDLRGGPPALDFVVAAVRNALSGCP